MYAADNPQIQQLFDASARDEYTIALPVPDEVFGFHAQQAVEKLYKVLITAHGVEHAFTHRLTVLHGHLIALGEVVPTLPMGLDELSEFAVEFRYESGKPFSADQREGLRAAVAALREFVSDRCEQLKQAGLEVKRP